MSRQRFAGTKLAIGQQAQNGKSQGIHVPENYTRPASV
jgi:hypothetical protein